MMKHDHKLRQNGMQVVARIADEHLGITRPGKHVGGARPGNIPEVARIAVIGLSVGPHLSEPKPVAKAAIILIVGMGTFDRTTAKDGLKPQRLRADIAQSEQAALIA